jgi:hypothetical protein
VLTVGETITAPVEATNPNAEPRVLYITPTEAIRDGEHYTALLSVGPPVEQSDNSRSSLAEALSSLSSESGPDTLRTRRRFDSSSYAPRPFRNPSTHIREHEPDPQHLRERQRPRPEAPRHTPFPARELSNSSTAPFLTEPPSTRSRFAGFRYERESGLSGDFSLRSGPLTPFLSRSAENSEVDLDPIPASNSSRERQAPTIPPLPFEDSPFRPRRNMSSSVCFTPLV